MTSRALQMMAAAAMVAVLAPSTSIAQTCNAYHATMPDGKPSAAVTSAANNDHVSFFFRRVVDRSYSVEVTQVGRDYSAGIFSVSLNTSDCPTTNMAGLRDTAVLEPSPQGVVGYDTVRFSFTATATGTAQIRAGATAGTVVLQARIFDTTLFSDWFFVGGDYSAYTIIRNTVNATVNYRVAWRNAAGSILGTQSGILPANGSTFFDARNIAGTLAAVSGTVEITHDAPPGAIVASTTVLSISTGLSFDAPFATR